MRCDGMACLHARQAAAAAASLPVQHMLRLCTVVTLRPTHAAGRTTGAPRATQSSAGITAAMQTPAATVRALSLALACLGIPCAAVRPLLCSRARRLRHARAAWPALKRAQHAASWSTLALPMHAGHIGICVPDVAAACARFEALGVDFVKRPNEGKMRCAGVYHTPPPRAPHTLHTRSPTSPLPLSSTAATLRSSRTPTDVSAAGREGTGRRREASAAAAATRG